MLVRYDFTKHGYCEKFLDAKLENYVSPTQFTFRFKNYFNKRMELAKVQQPCTGVVDLIVHGQFANSGSKDL